MNVTVDIVTEGGNWPGEDELRPLLETAVSSTMDHLGLMEIESELSVLLIDDEGIRAINAEWRNKDKPTNVLSFPAVQLSPGERPGPMLGDVIFARETIEREAAIDGKTFNSHLSHLAVHGLLHLLGYDHENDNDAEQMEGLEKVILARMGIADPYGESPIDKE